MYFSNSVSEANIASSSLEPPKHLADAKFGSYNARFDTIERRIYPKGRDGKSVPVTLTKHTITIRHEKDDESGEIILSRYKHQGKWFWRDSRDKNSCNRNHVVNEVKRMLKVDDPCAFVKQFLKG